MKYHFKIHREGTGFWAQCIELPGCFTQGDSKEELIVNMKEALNAFIEESSDAACLAPLPDASNVSNTNIVEVPLDPEVAFGFMVRYFRVQNGMTQKEAAHHLGMKNIFSYQRLERRCNPTLDVMKKLRSIFPKLSVDRLFS